MPCLERTIRLLAAGVLAGATGVAHPQIAARTVPANEAELVSRAQGWLSGRYQIQTSAIGIQPMDPRIQTRGCEGGWQFDQPFAGNEGMLRARCPQDNWQVFLKVMLPARPVAAASAPAAPTAQMVPVALRAAPPAPPVPVVAPTPHLIKRGQTVLATWAPVAGLMVSARLEALDDGRLGEVVRLKNRDTGRIVSGVVSGQNTAQGL
jgi:flagella basal body P-ring formation protein FlgA